MKGSVRHYKDEDLIYLIEWYKKIGMKEMAAALDRTPLAVAQKYKELKKKGIVQNYVHQISIWEV
jgi:Mn-dependent DtxR family transcriptional regulator